MNKDILLQLFKAHYIRQNFIDNVIVPIFKGKVANITIYENSAVVPIRLTDSEAEYVKSAVKYGEIITADELPRTIELYEVIVDNTKQIERSRVGLNALVKKHIIGDNAVMVNFAYDKPENRSWRFSFIARDGIFQDGEMKVVDTNPKRYTYVFGQPDETFKTAIDRFTTLANEYEITINKIKDAFSVEAMSKAFFDDYRDVHYAGFVDYLMRSNFHKSAFNSNDKDVRDFVKKLLGRIVFLYFLQKKGWMGASNTEYKDGDKNFISNYFRQSGADDAFYPNWLTKLFFEALNSPRTNDDFVLPNGKTVKIPYLNGGLFEKQSEKYDFLTFPAEMFENLFNFFDQYNFTIFEDSPEEHTVAVDPEMLGHIFENLLEDNKDKGAFYTPKEIVYYMTQESLIEYLHTQLPDADKNELEAFIKNKPSNLSNDIKATIGQKLDTVKICDPAIGSGAFPMGLLQEIYSIKERIAFDLHLPWDNTQAAATKANIIQNSIYGVDIERGAVDIARLRFWLSLIVDEEKPKSLPNLDYKIVVGNSLVSKFEDTVIEIDWSLDTAKEGLFGQELAEEKIMLLKKISEKQNQYFLAENNEKPKLKAEINQLKIDILIKQLQLMIETKGFNQESMQGLNKKQLEVWQQTQDWKTALTQLKQLKENPDKSFNHFDWKLDFPEVLNPLVNNNCGFDIVIGNPPYIKVQSINKQDSLYYKKRYKSASGKYDIYLLFLEFSFDIVKENGNNIFINPHRFLIADYGKDLRTIISKDKWLKSILYFGVDQVFSNATTYSGVFHFKKNSLFVEFAEPKDKNITDVKFSRIPYDLLGDTWLVTTDSNVVNVLNKIYTYPSILTYCEGVYQGVISVGDKIFMLNGSANDGMFVGYSEQLNEEVSLEKNSLKAVLKGEDIRRYKPLNKKKYVIYLHEENNKGKTVPMEESYISANFPLTYSYLLNFKNELVKKKLSYKTNPNFWYSMHRSRELSILNKKNKIITPQLQNKPNFTIDISGEFYPDAGGYMVIPKEEYLSLSYSILGVLNSKLFYYFIVNTSTPYNNNYFYFKTNYIEPFCIPEKIFNINPILQIIVSSVIFLNGINLDSKYSETFEEIIDALVFELYFPEDFKEKNIEIAKHAEELFKPLEDLTEEEQLATIEEVYNRYREKSNPLRNQIKLMKIELSELLLPILSV